ncbi:MATE family efflux transporter [Clostridium sediminicola]|uniref:MATE family efflux transporter n=1 Tax=Clostridium sediminicola TaxID=3114879 RepID=UPI0031F1CA10
MSNKNVQNKMGTMSIPKLMITMSLPAIFAMLVQATYNVVDSMFVARVSKDALTAVSLAFPIQLIIIALFVGLGIGINSLISRKLGENDTEAASNVAEHGFLLSVILYLILLIIGIFFAAKFFPLFTENKNVINLGTHYIKIIMIFSFGRILAQAGMSILQGTGDMMNPMKAQLIGAITNIILDPIFIFGYFGIPAMGVKGAAIATVLGQILSMIYIIVVVFTKEHHVKLNMKNFKYDSNIFKGIVLVGLPAAIMQAIASVMLTGLNLILASFGDTPLTVLGVYYKLQSFVFMPIFGLAQGTMPIIGFNYGSKNKERLAGALKLGAIAAFLYMFLGLIVFQVIPVQLLVLFKSSDEMIKIGVKALRTISLCFPFAAISIMCSTAFQGMGKAHVSMIVSILRQLVVLLPVAFILSKAFGLDGVWYAFLISELVSFTVVLIIFKSMYKNQMSEW